MYYPADTDRAPALFHSCPATEGSDVGKFAIITIALLIVNVPPADEKPFLDTTGPLNVVVAILISPYKVITYQSCMRLLGQFDKSIMFPVLLSYYLFRLLSSPLFPP